MNLSPKDVDRGSDTEVDKRPVSELLNIGTKPGLGGGGGGGGGEEEDGDDDDEEEQIFKHKYVYTSEL
jgi:hypothetical protein